MTFVLISEENTCPQNSAGLLLVPVNVCHPEWDVGDPEREEEKASEGRQRKEEGGGREERE